MKSFSLVIDSPRKEHFSGNVTSVTINTKDGEYQLLADKSPCLIALYYGKLSFKLENGEVKTGVAAKGFALTADNNCKIFTDNFIWIEEIDADLQRHKIEEIKSRVELLNNRALHRENVLAAADIARASARLKALGLLTNDK